MVEPNPVRARSPVPNVRGAQFETKPVVITVTAGKPSELAFKLSKYSRLPVGTPIEFKVTDGGVAFHDFKICTSPKTSFKANTCTGLGTKVLHPGQTATLTVTLKSAGLYEFLCTVAGHAAAGMKGLVGVGVAVTTAQESAAKTTGGGSTTTSTATTTTSATTTTATTTTTAGGTGPDDCPPGKTIASAGQSDNDGDEIGATPTDGDGCV